VRALGPVRARFADVEAARRAAERAAAEVWRDEAARAFERRVTTPLHAEATWFAGNLEEVERQLTQALAALG